MQNCNVITTVQNDWTFPEAFYSLLSSESFRFLDLNWGLANYLLFSSIFKRDMHAFFMETTGKWSPVRFRPVMVCSGPMPMSEMTSVHYVCSMWDTSPDSFQSWLLIISPTFSFSRLQYRALVCGSILLHSVVASYPLSILRMASIDSTV